MTVTTKTYWRKSNNLKYLYLLLKTRNIDINNDNEKI